MRYKVPASVLIGSDDRSNYIDVPGPGGMTTVVEAGGARTRSFESGEFSVRTAHEAVSLRACITVISRCCSLKIQA